MSSTVDVLLDPAAPGSWGSLPVERLFSLNQGEVEEAQRLALARRFDTLRPRLAALDTLASLQGVERVKTFDDVVPVLFDHRVYKSYPMSLVEKRRFGRLTAWLQRLTTHSIASVPMEGVSSVDSWLDRLGEHGLSVGHTTGTSGKLSFLPHSDDEWPTFSPAYFNMMHSLLGVDTRVDKLPFFTPGLRRGHYWLGARLARLYAQADGGDSLERHYLHDYSLSADLMSLAARIDTAERRGQLDKLSIDQGLLTEREQLLEWSRHREEHLQRWLELLAKDYRGQRVRIQGTAADLVRVALRGRELGVVLEPARDSILMPGGGMKSYKDAPADWEGLLKDFYGVDRLYFMYGMTESLGYAPRCDEGFYHFFPYTLPIVLDSDFAPLPREGVQTGRMALFDFLAESYWGGYISGDQVTIHWDSSCDCGRQGPRIGPAIVRFSDLQGVEDDKISCAGTEAAYNSFMDYIAEI